MTQRDNLRITEPRQALHISRISTHDTPGNLVQNEHGKRAPYNTGGSIEMVYRNREKEF